MTSFEADAAAIVEWVLGVRVQPPRLGLYDGDLIEDHLLVGALLVAGADRHARLATHGGTATPAHLVDDVVEDEAWRESTRARLGAATAPSRHLFVWVDDRDQLTCAAMDADQPPDGPMLPTEVNVAWVARAAAPGSPYVADRLWQTDESGEWEALGPNRGRPPARLFTSA